MRCGLLKTRGVSQAGNWQAKYETPRNFLGSSFHLYCRSAGLCSVARQKAAIATPKYRAQRLEALEALMAAEGNKAAVRGEVRRRSRRAAVTAQNVLAEVKLEAEPLETSEPTQTGPNGPSERKKKKRSYANAYTRRNEGFSALVDQLAFGDVPAAPPAAAVVKVEAVAVPTADSGEKPKRRKRRAKALEEEPPPGLAEEVEGTPNGAAKKSKRTRKSRKAAATAQPEDAAAVAAVKPEPGEAADAPPLDQAALIAAPKRRRRRNIDPNAFQIPELAIVDEAERTTPAPRPVPNLGFACLNATLRSQKPAIFSNRNCIKRTWEAKGLECVSQLCVENTRALLGLVLWNHLHGIRFFRLSSKIFPWCTEWDIEQLQQKEEIIANLAAVGRLARAYDQRLTFHPSHFVKLGCADGPLLDRSIRELEVHSQMLDLMGYKPSPENKINIHIGGMYGDKEATMERFAKNVSRLSPGCRARLTVENDDWTNAYSIADLLRLHELVGVPLVFDFHHHRFCPGGLTEEEALRAALATWPKGVRPVVHWSESQEGRRPSAHSDFVKGPLRLYGFEADVDVMIEAKGKELALLRLRDPDFRPSAAALATIADDG